jgi:hypothetical protein
MGWEFWGGWSEVGENTTRINKEEAMLVRVMLLMKPSSFPSFSFVHLLLLIVKILMLFTNTLRLCLSRLFSSTNIS